MTLLGKHIAASFIFRGGGAIWCIHTPLIRMHPLPPLPLCTSLVLCVLYNSYNRPNKYLLCKFHDYIILEKKNSLKNLKFVKKNFLLKNRSLNIFFYKNIFIWTTNFTENTWVSEEREDERERKFTQAQWTRIISQLNKRFALETQF